jgi:hypothetical protein
MFWRHVCWLCASVSFASSGWFGATLPFSLKNFGAKLKYHPNGAWKIYVHFPDHYELSQLSSPIFMLFVQENAVAHVRKCFKLLSGKIYFDLCSCCVKRSGPSLGMIQDPSNRLNTTHGHSGWLTLADQAQIIQLYTAVLYITSTQYLWYWWPDSIRCPEKKTHECRSQA